VKASGGPLVVPYLFFNSRCSTPMISSDIESGHAIVHLNPTHDNIEAS
jgi:hypothetical protein